MKSGTVRLVSAKDETLESIAYKSKTQREAIVDFWMRMYGAKFHLLFVQIVPDISPEPDPPAQPVKKNRRNCYKPIGGGVNSFKIPKGSSRTHYL